MKAFGKTSATNGIETIDVPVPDVASDEFLVKVKAIGVGIHDEYFHATDIDYPYVIGIEAAGVVEEVGKNVTNYKKGERIAFISMMQPKGGTWAEYAVISDKSLILRMPKGMTFEQAAAIPVPANTAFKALHEAGLEQGESLFIAGGAGAIGGLLIQIATKRGYKVLTSASSKNHEFMKELGADFVVDYHDNNWKQEVLRAQPNGVDAAIAIHPGTPQEVQAVVKDRGKLIAVSGDDFATERGIELRGVFNNIEVKDELIEFMGLVVSGEIKLTVGRVYSFADALKALKQVKTRHTRGKLVISMSND